MPFSTILGIAIVCALASAVNGYLGGGFLLFLWMVLQGMINDSVRYAPEIRIVKYTWSPHLLLPVAIFLIVWQWRLRGRIGPQYGVRDIVRMFRRQRSSYA